MAIDDRNRVQSVAKAFAVLRAFGQSEMTITDVANAAGLDRGTAFRLIHTLVELGYLAPVPETRRFWLTLKCLELGHAALSAGGLRGLAKPLLRRFVPDLGEAASLAMLEGPDVVYLERVQVEACRLGVERRVGSRVGAYAAAMGHAILAWRDPAEARAVLLSGDRMPLSPHTLVDIDALCDRLTTVRAQGYALSDGENAYRLRTIAAPVLWQDGTSRAALSVSVRAEHMALDMFVARTLPPLLEAAASLSDALRMTSLAA